MAKKSSSIIEETVKEMPDGRTILYGTMKNTLRATVKGMYLATEKRTVPIQNQAAEEMEKAAQRAMSRAIERKYGTSIVTTMFTFASANKAIAMKPKRYSYTIYVHLENCDAEKTAIEAVETASNELRKTMETYGFALSTARQTHSGGKKKKKN